MNIELLGLNSVCSFVVHTAGPSGEPMCIVPNALVQCDQLSLLERLPDESVQIVYLDPPWLTGDRAADRCTDCEQLEREYLDMISHVLQQCRRLISETGCFFLHARPSQVYSSIRLILDQVFGRERFLNEYVVPYTVPRALLRSSTPNHAALVAYGKSATSELADVGRPRTDQELRERYPLVDDKGRYRCSNLLLPLAQARLGQQFEWHSYRPEHGRAWRFGADRLDELDREGRIEFGGSRGAPQLKTYSDDDPVVPIGTVWDDLEGGGLRQIDGRLRARDRSMALSERIILLASEPGDIIVDPLCRDGATALAASRLGRRWIIANECETVLAEWVKEWREASAFADAVPFQRWPKEAVLSQPVLGQGYWPINTTADSLMAGLDLRFVLNEPVPIEETRHYEFKEVKGSNPVRTIVNAADEYAVGFLNSEGGRIFWGVRDEDRATVGVVLMSESRNELRRDVTNKLSGIQPPIDPTLYRLKLHNVIDGDGQRVPDMYVVELTVPRVGRSEPYYTQSGDCFVKLDAVNKRLRGPELTSFARQTASSRDR